MKGAQRASWAVAFAAEASAVKGKQHLASLLDLVKAFERIPHHLVALAATRLGYNLVILRLSLAAYRFERRVGVGGIYSRAVRATRGITAGSTFATSELRILLTPLVTHAYHRFGWSLSIQL